MLLIRADANNKIGLGHVMRCLTIAEAAEKAGIKTVFLMADDGAEELLKGRGQAYHILHTDFADMEGELPALYKVIENCTKTEYRATSIQEAESGDRSKIVFLLDSYQTTEKYVRELKTRLNKNHIQLALMEDYGNSPYHADILINYNIYGTDFSYEKNAPKTLLGCRYMPLRQAFVQQKYEVREQVKNLLITTGGSDTYRIGAQLAKQLADKQFADNSKLSLHIVCGKFSQSREELLQLANQKENITIHTDVKEMWTLMSGCDAAISAAGTTLYELCAIGIPTICFSFAENQTLPGTAFAAHTPIPYAGDYEQNPNAMFATILTKLEDLCTMPKAERKQISSQLKTTVDGKGPQRIITALFT